ncbi:hypothetical protein F5B22DRAFT_640973 [Xylaria bambusicola]|uniref:uncharacterized protein n=1 Tax=Xylaria bambusicola TaxID=326684 RepID=UPI0020080287|nr:uncharacterized protein F5B22DRAFT_640973 [Xylaria bambusicola]KAI0527998.1 hypothetical protein F5B22DRAFT_640973 [Xylaria bambusicola]
MSIGIQDLSDELVVRMTSVLARRPEYGIGIPSRRWLQRQEEKIKDLPKELQRPSGLKRLAIKIVDHIDPNIVDPQAVLCKTHSALNPFLIRRLFIALAYEVTVHTDSLRLWSAKTLDPELSALVGRLDSIVALWTAPELFHEIYGLAPFDGYHVFVQSGCEACSLAAIGASGRALADLRATLVNRMEECQERGSRKGSGKVPRLYRIVEAWIDQLRKRCDDADRVEQCRAWSEALLVDLRMARPQIKSWRAKQKRRRAKLEDAKRPVYSELRRTSTGAEIAPLPPSAGGKRRTRNGIPVALVDIKGAEDQRRAAKASNRRESIYRPDSLSGDSDVHRREKSARERNTSANTRPPAPEPARMSGPSDASPTGSFLHRFEQEIPIGDDFQADENLEEDNELDDNDYAEKSRARVQEWFSSQFSHPELNLSQDDTQSILSMVHPAFRPNASHIAASALPSPLDVRKKCEPSSPQIGGYKAASSVWTDCTTYTQDEANNSSIPPVPRIPSEYRTDKRSLDSAGQGSSPRVPRPSSGYSRQTSTTSFPRYKDPFITRAESVSSSSSSTKGKRKNERENPAPNWPAPPHGHPPDSPRRQGPFLPQSDVGSAMSEQRHAFLMDRFRPKEEPLQERNSTSTNHSDPRASTATKSPERPPGMQRASSSVYSRSSISGFAGSEKGTVRDGSAVTSRSAATAQAQRNDVGGDAPRSNKTPGPRYPPPPSAVTELGNFRGKM